MLPFKKTPFASSPRLAVDIFAWQADDPELEPVIVAASLDVVPNTYPNTCRASIMTTEAGISSLAEMMKRDGVAKDHANGIIGWYLNDLRKAMPDAYAHDQYLVLLVNDELLPPKT